MLAHYETFNCTIIQWSKKQMACAACILEPWKPISDPVQCSKWVGPGTFQNGSLACNIIRNTLGYHLIFLQCDHEDICSWWRENKCDLSWRVLLSSSSFSLQMGTSQATSLHDLHCVSKTEQRVFLLWSCVHAAFILNLHEWAFFFSLVKFNKSIERAHLGWGSLSLVSLFIYFFLQYCIGNTFIYEQGHVWSSRSA